MSSRVSRVLCLASGQDQVQFQSSRSWQVGTDGRIRGRSLAIVAWHQLGGRGVAQWGWTKTAGEANPSNRLRRINATFENTKTVTSQNPPVSASHPHLVPSALRYLDDGCSAAQLPSAFFPAAL